MKIFLVLLGYLAVTTSFNQFAFGSPTDVPVVEHDGDSKFLQQRSDALMKRNPGEIVETRQIEVGVAEVTPVAMIVIGIAVVIAASVIWILDDNPKREAYTQDTATKLTQQYPKFNWVVCHSPYIPSFDGTEGTDWGRTHHEVSISFGRKIGYDLLWAKSGIFVRQGDGGFINWAHNGNVTRIHNLGSHISVVFFGTRS